MGYRRPNQEAVRRALGMGAAGRCIGFAPTGLGSIPPGALGDVPTPVLLDGIPSPVSRPVPNPATFRRVKVPAGTRGTIATMQIMGDLAREAVNDQWFTQEARSIVRGIPSKDYEGEGRAILDWFKGAVDYRHDPMSEDVDWVQSPGWTIYVEGQGDCFTEGTLVLRREGMKLVPIEWLRPGDEIWGYDRWSVVQNTWDRGVRPTWAVRLNNGSVKRFSPEHKFYVARCGHAEGKKCSCPLSEREIERIDFRDLRPKDVVLTPERVGFGSQEMDPRRAWIEGLYVADGWTDRPSQFSISGRDGFPREQQKRDVQRLCEEMGIRTAWGYNAIAVQDRDWTDRMKAMGQLPWDKHILSLDLAEEAARETLRGVLADSGRDSLSAGRTFTTSSRQLHLQTRVLLKMFGLACSESFIQDHGSTSQHPIWRLGIRQHPNLDALGVIYDKAWKKNAPRKCPEGSKFKILRVEEIVKDEAPVQCYDVATDDHYVYLPEVDWTVSNCDDGCTAIAALDMAAGHGAMFRAVQLDPSQPGVYTHVYPMIGIRKGNDVQWIAQDFVNLDAPFGEEPPRSMWVGPPNDLILAMP